MTPSVSDSEAYITAPCFIINSLTTVGFINVAANTKYENIFANDTIIISSMIFCGFILMSKEKDLEVFQK